MAAAATAVAAAAAAATVVAARVTAVLVTAARGAARTGMAPGVARQVREARQVVAAAIAERPLAQVAAQTAGV